MGQAACACQCIDSKTTSSNEVDLALPIDHSAIGVNDISIEADIETTLTKAAADEPDDTCRTRGATEASTCTPGPTPAPSPTAASSEGGRENLAEQEELSPAKPEETRDQIIPDSGFTERAGDEIVEAALAKVEVLIKSYDILEAESVFAQALDKLGCLPQEGVEAPPPSPAAAAAAEKLRSSRLFKQVQDLIAQYDPTIDMLFNNKHELLYENDFGKFEIWQPHGSETWFDYRMTCHVEAPLPETLSTAEELDLVPKAQRAVVETPQRIGPENGFLSTSLTKMPVAIFSIELLFEALRVRDHRSGFLLESIRSAFPANDRKIPDKAWRSVRPWVWVANCWMPRGGGKKGTILVQVTRVDPGFHVPHWVLSFVFRQLALGFMQDLRHTAALATEQGSLWRQRVEQDKNGFYKGLKEVDGIAAHRKEVTGLPEREFFDNRPWRLRPAPQDTRPPSSRAAHSKKK